DTIDKAIHMKLVEPKACITKTLHIHGYRPKPNLDDHCYVYGADEPALHKMEEENPTFKEKISPKYEYTVGEAVWAVRNEMARTVDDVLARRVRMLYIDAREALAVAPKVAHIVASELGRDEAWEQAQVESFTEIAKKYIVEC
ncbi:MAG: FAD-dependent oxidoreductase, partial [Bacteroidaceae bacterium]|nr:FAD-dependent oxidoreductase [Bacteroidaceae bacterium]